MPKINALSIHHIVVFECDPNFNGSVVEINHNSFTDPFTQNCSMSAFGLANIRRICIYIKLNLI